MHRQNLFTPLSHDRLAVDSTPTGWKSRMCSITAGRSNNRAALMPTREQIEGDQPHRRGSAHAAEGRSRHRLCRAGLLCARPEGMHGRLGRGILQRVAGREGAALPRRREPARIRFPLGATTSPVADIWHECRGLQAAIAAPTGCRSRAAIASRREIDFGGCRCQAFALTGDAGNADPACTLSPLHEQIFKLAEAEAAAGNTRFIYRNFAGGTPETGGDHGA